MTSDHLPARWVLLASAGLACLLTGLAAWWFPEWTGAHLFVPVLLGIGLPPVVALTAGMGLWWSSESVRVRLDQARAWAQELANQARELEIKAVTAITATDDDPAAPEPDLDLRARAWATALGRFFRAGDKAGFTIRALTPAVLSEDDWARLTGFYVTDDGRRVLRDRGGNQGTGWGHGWDLDGAMRALGAGALPLPAGEPPVVEVYVADATQRNARPRKAAVVEGTAREVGR